MNAHIVPLRPSPAPCRALEVPAVIAPGVNLLRFSEALARAGIVGRHDADRGVLVIEEARSEQRTQDGARAVMRWWNGLSKAERAHWLDRAWKRAAPAGHYTLDSMPSAADAWAAFQAAQRCPECGGTRCDDDAYCAACDGTGREGCASG